MSLLSQPTRRGDADPELRGDGRQRLPLEIHAAHDRALALQQRIDRAIQRRDGAGGLVAGGSVDLVRRQHREGVGLGLLRANPSVPPHLLLHRVDRRPDRVAERVVPFRGPADRVLDEREPSHRGEVLGRQAGRSREPLCEERSMRAPSSGQCSRWTRGVTRGTALMTDLSPGRRRWPAPPRGDASASKVYLVDRPLIFIRPVRFFVRGCYRAGLMVA